MHGALIHEVTAVISVSGHTLTIHGALIHEVTTVISVSGDT